MLFTKNTESALQILRRPDLTMKWYIIPLLLIVLYIASKELRAKRYSVLLGALALWGMDIFNEIWNSIVCHATHFAPVWGTPANTGGTSLLLLIGYNIEISFMFFIMGVAYCLSLPKEKETMFFGRKINNRIPIILISTLGGVIVEIFLNKAGLLTWEHSWWNAKKPYLIYLIGYLPFFTIATLVHDAKKYKTKFTILGVLFGVNILALIIFGNMGWM